MEIVVLKGMINQRENERRAEAEAEEERKRKEFFAGAPGDPIK